MWCCRNSHHTHSRSLPCEKSHFSSSCSLSLSLPSFSHRRRFFLLKLFSSLLSSHINDSRTHTQCMHTLPVRLWNKWPQPKLFIAFCPFIRLMSHDVLRCFLSFLGNPFPCSCELRRKLDSVRRNVPRISSSFSQSLTFNHDVNTFKKQEFVPLNFNQSFEWQSTRHQWDSLTCESPASSTSSGSKDQRMRSVVISYLTHEQLMCPESERKFLLEGDVMIRGSYWVPSQRDHLRVVWLVYNEVEDIAKMKVQIQELSSPSQSSHFESVEVAYTDREYTFRGLSFRKSHQICLKTFDSAGNERPSFPNNCIVTPAKVS